MIGKTFDDFTITDRIGTGGMGQVFVGLQNSLEREVAIKVIFNDSSLAFGRSEIIERFLREARMTASIQHPNIVNIHKVGQGEGFMYIVMEYIDGPSLDVELKKGPLPELTAWQIAIQICQGLQAALQKGIIHRDIKPANILLAHGNVVKLTDFGLSKKISDQSQLTQAGIILGSPSYMSPEQAAGKPVSYHTDIYSLGATIYHMLSGQMLFPGKNVVDILYKHQAEKPVSPHQHVPDLKLESCYILAKMLDKTPQARYQSYGDIIADITALLAHKPLIFASPADARFVFRQHPDFQKKAPISKRLFGPLFGNVFSSSKSSKPQHMIIWATGVSPDLNLPRYSDCKFHLILSLTELRNLLQGQSAFVILDSKYLGAETIDFLDVLKHEFPQTPVVIMVDRLPPEIDPQEEALFLVLPGDQENEFAQLLAERLRNPLRAHQLNLKPLLALAAQYKWSTCLQIDTAQAQGSIILRQGKVVTAQQGQMKGQAALEWLLSHHCAWESGKHLKNSMQLRAVVADQMSASSAKEKTELLDRPVGLSGTQENQGPQPLQVTQKKQNHLNVQTRMTSSEMSATNYTTHYPAQAPPSSLETAKTLLAKPTTTAPPTPSHPSAAALETAETMLTRPVSSQVSSSTESRQTLASAGTEQPAATDGSASQNLPASVVGPTAETPEELFDYHMDQALDALLSKDYQQAYHHFRQAKQIRPDDARLKINLQRLEKMGYHER